MKSTEAFKKIIQKYLEERASSDSLFAETFKKEGKNIDDCITYILNTVKKSGCTGFSDDEIYGMSVHYYDEDKIDIGDSISSQVVVNHKVELTEEDKNEAREKAKKEFQENQMKQLRQSQERKEAKEKKKQEKLKAAEVEKKTRKQESEKQATMLQQSLF
jgi:hypothetical protein